MLDLRGKAPLLWDTQSEWEGHADNKGCFFFFQWEYVHCHIKEKLRSLL